GQGTGVGGLVLERSADLSGVVNGIDISVWDPATDQSIASRFAIGALQNRAPNKAGLQRRMGVEVLPDAFLLGVVSRLSWQKGLDLLRETLPAIVNGGMQLALLGDGDAELRDGYHAAAQANPGRIGVVIGYDG